MKLQTRNTSFSRKYYLNSYIILIIICASHLAFSNTNPSTIRRCPRSFTDHSNLETQIYELADTAYQIRQRVTNLFHIPKEKKDIWIKDLENLEDRLLDLLESGRIRKINPERIETFLRHREWQIYQEKRLVYKQPTTPKPNGKDISWDMLIENPTLVKPNHPYALQFANNTFLHYITFHSKVVNKFFNKERMYNEKLARKFLTTIRKGFINSRDSKQVSGIKRLDLNKSNRQNDIIEVKTIGGISGHIRLGGFLIGNTIYITDFFKSSNHNRIATERFANRLLNQLNIQLENPESTFSHF